MECGESSNQQLVEYCGSLSIVEETNTNTHTNNNRYLQRRSGTGEHEHYIPLANVVRIMRKILPANAKISEDAKETVKVCVSEFIRYITSEANDRCQSEQRRTITPEDILSAMQRLGFDNSIQCLTTYLNNYRRHESELNSAPGQPIVTRTVDYVQPQVPESGGYELGGFYPMDGNYTNSAVNQDAPAGNEEEDYASALVSYYPYATYDPYADHKG